MIYAQYQDDGPRGICGQSTYVTNPWNRLYIFETEEVFRLYIPVVESTKSRKNPRFSNIWSDDIWDSYDKVEKIKPPKL